MKRGLFVTFEGGEGAGKSTLACRLRDAFKASGREVVYTREPGGTPFGEELRSLLLHHKGEVSIKAELFLFLASRIQHLDQLIKPALARGSLVLCDRFTDSTIAYQGAARGLGVSYVTTASELATNGMQPDLTFYVDIDPHVGLERTSRRRHNRAETIDRLEKEAMPFHEKVRGAYQTLAREHPNRIVVLDGTEDPDLLFADAYSRISSLN